MNELELLLVAKDAIIHELLSKAYSVVMPDPKQIDDHTAEALIGFRRYDGTKIKTYQIKIELIDET